MSLCPNCKTKLSCGCQKRTASDGATACTTCINAYEAALKKKKAQASGSSSGVTVLFNGSGTLNVSQ